MLVSDRYGLGVDTAIPNGLIINNLVSNALKCDFHNRKEGEIKLLTKQLSDSIEINHQATKFQTKFSVCQNI